MKISGYRLSGSIGRNLKNYCKIKKKKSKVTKGLLLFSFKNAIVNILDVNSRKILYIYIFLTMEVLIYGADDIYRERLL